MQTFETKTIFQPVAQSLGDEAARLIQGLDPDDPSLATGMGCMCMKVASRLRDF